MHDHIRPSTGDGIVDGDGIAQIGGKGLHLIRKRAGGAMDEDGNGDIRLHQELAD